MNIVDIFKEGADISSKNIVIFVPIFVVMLLMFILSMLLFEFGIFPFGFMGGFTGGGMGMYPSGMPYSPFSFFFSGWFIFMIIVFSIMEFIAYGATIGMASEAAEKGSASLANGINTALGRIAPLLLGALIIGIIVGVGIVLLVIPGLIAAFFLMFAPVAIVVDKMDAVSAIKRSVTMVKQNLNDALVFFIAVVLVSAVFIIARMAAGVVPFIGYPIGLIFMGVLSSYIAVVTVKFYKKLSGNSAGVSAGLNS
jgi:hypothetical protein